MDTRRTSSGDQITGNATAKKNIHMAIARAYQRAKNGLFCTGRGLKWGTD